MCEKQIIQNSGGSRCVVGMETQTPKRNAKEQEVIDKVALEEADDYIDHYNLKLTRSRKISAKSIRQLKKLGLKHHVLGKTFP